MAELARSTDGALLRASLTLRPTRPTLLPKGKKKRKKSNQACLTIFTSFLHYQNIFFKLSDALFSICSFCLSSLALSLAAALRHFLLQLVPLALQLLPN